MILLLGRLRYNRIPSTSALLSLSCLQIFRVLFIGHSRLVSGSALLSPCHLIACWLRADHKVVPLALWARVFEVLFETKFHLILLLVHWLDRELLTAEYWGFGRRCLEHSGWSIRVNLHPFAATRASSSEVNNTWFLNLLDCLAAVLLLVLWPIWKLLDPCWDKFVQRFFLVPCSFKLNDVIRRGWVSCKLILVKVFYLHNWLVWRLFIGIESPWVG